MQQQKDGFAQAGNELMVEKKEVHHPVVQMLKQKDLSKEVHLLPSA